MAERQNNSETVIPRRAPATTAWEREQQLIAGAYDLAEEQLRTGKISATVHAQLLRAGSQRERMEQEKLRVEVAFKNSQIEALESQKSQEELYSKALSAMRRYSGNPDDDETE